MANLSNLILIKNTDDSDLFDSGFRLSNNYQGSNNQSYQRNSNQDQHRGQLDSNHLARSETQGLGYDDKPSNDDSPFPDVTYKLRFEDVDIDPITVMLDSGIETTLMTEDLADELGLLICRYPLALVGLGGEVAPTNAIGFTKMFIRVKPHHKEICSLIYVYDNLPHRLILGKNFLFRAEINLQFNEDKSCRILRYGQPLIATARVPGIALWENLFEEYFDNFFGPNKGKEKMKEIWLNQRSKDKDERKPKPSTLEDVSSDSDWETNDWDSKQNAVSIDWD